MSDLYKIGDSVSGKKIYFCFGFAPVAPRFNKKIYSGAFRLHGQAYEYPAVSFEWDNKPTELDKIICEEAHFSYSKKTDLRKNHSEKCGNHTCYDGIIKKNASVIISKPIRSVRNRPN